MEILVAIAMTAAFGASLFGAFGEVVQFWAVGFLGLSVIAGMMSIG